MKVGRGEALAGSDHQRLESSGEAMYYLRFLSLALLASALSLIGCAEGNLPKVGEGDRPGSVQPLPEAQPMRYLSWGSGMTTRQRLVIRDDAGWTSFWQQSAGTGQPVPAAPVDFASQIVIVAAMGTKNTGGYSIDIDDVRVVDGAAQITVTERSPGNNCGVTQAETAPVAAIAVPRFSGEATFVERTVQHACE